MKKFHLTILGTNAAGPAYGRITTCQYLQHDKTAFLIDCGEACQIRLSQYKLKANKIDTICISHLHGDHCLGLPGMLSSFSNGNRNKSLTLIGPKGLKNFVNDFVDHTYARITYKINFLELDHTEKSLDVFENEDLKVSAFPLKHRIPTYGYRFQEKHASINIRKQAIQEFQLSIEEIKSLKQAKNVTRDNGEILDWRKCSLNPSLPRSYSFCSDTIYDEGLIEYISKSQYLYHETTYLHELAELAKERMHSTALEAGQIALKAKVRNLITGHYSSRYKHVDQIVDEAKRIFPHVIKGYDGFMLEIPKETAIIDHNLI